jgi:hypothetical protein
MGIIFQHVAPKAERGILAPKKKKDMTFHQGHMFLHHPGTNQAASPPRPPKEDMENVVEYLQRLKGRRLVEDALPKIL